MICIWNCSETKIKSMMYSPAVYSLTACKAQQDIFFPCKTIWILRNPFFGKRETEMCLIYFTTYFSFFFFSSSTSWMQVKKRKRLKRDGKNIIQDDCPLLQTLFVLPREKSSGWATCQCTVVDIKVWRTGKKSEILAEVPPIYQQWTLLYCPLLVCSDINARQGMQISISYLKRLSVCIPVSIRARHFDCTVDWYAKKEDFSLCTRLSKENAILSSLSLVDRFLRIFCVRDMQRP